MTQILPFSVKVLSPLRGVLYPPAITSRTTVSTTAELPPTITSNRPGSTTRAIDASRNERCSGPSVNSTVRVSPGFNAMRWKPRNSLTGR